MRAGSPSASVLLLLLLVAGVPPACRAQPSDAEVLLWLKDSFVNGEEGLSSWQSGSDPCSGWLGVECTSGLVTTM